MAKHRSKEGEFISQYWNSNNNMDEISRRDFLRLVALGLGGLVLSSCRPSSANPLSQSSEKVKLVYQDSTSDWFLPMVQEMLAEFHADHPNIQVFYTPEPQGTLDKETKMLQDMQAGAAPDVFQGCCSWFPIWAQKGYTLDLRPFVEADLEQDVLDDWDPAQYRALFTHDGKQYGLPKYHGALALYYNKDLFDKYNVSYPDDTWDHDDYLDAMKRLAHDRDGDGHVDLWGSQTYITWDRIQMHVNGWGGHLIDPNDPSKCRIAEPEALAAQEWLRARMWDDRVMATPLDVKNMWPNEVFIAGQTAMVEDGSWQLKSILSNSDFRVGIAPLPAGPVRRVTLATTDGFGIYAGTKHPEAAWELVRFLISKNYGRAMARAGFLQPARESLVDEWAQIIRNEFPEKARDVDIAAFADGHRKGYSVVAEVAANMSEATRLVNEAWEEIYTLGKAPVEIMKEVSRQLELAQRPPN